MTFTTRQKKPATSMHPSSDESKAALAANDTARDKLTARLMLTVETREAHIELFPLTLDARGFTASFLDTVLRGISTRADGGRRQ